MVWIGVGQGLQEACALHDGLEKPLLKLGCYRREERRFTPHVTLGRVRSDKPMDQLAAALMKKQDYEAGAAMIREVLVMSSELSPEGPIYTVMSRAQLAATALPERRSRAGRGETTARRHRRPPHVVQPTQPPRPRSHPTSPPTASSVVEGAHQTASSRQKSVSRIECEAVGGVRR